MPHRKFRTNRRIGFHTPFHQERESRSLHGLSNWVSRLRTLRLELQLRCKVEWFWDLHGLGWLHVHKRGIVHECNFHSLINAASSANIWVLVQKWTNFSRFMVSEDTSTKITRSWWRNKRALGENSLSDRSNITSLRHYIFYMVLCMRSTTYQNAPC